jgi:transposase-like protein
MRTRRPPPATIPRSAFAGFCFPPDVIVLAVRWYLRFGLSYHDVEELLTERGIQVDHVTVYRWVQRFTSLLAEAARPCRHAVGDRWQVDETYIKVAGQWRYVYRAIDQFGQVIDVFVSPRRDAAAARQFFQRAIGTMRVAPVEVATDHAPVYPAVLEELLPAAWHRTDRHANNHIEADHGPWGTEMRSCSSSVLVQETAEQVPSVDPGWRVAADEGPRGGWIRRLKLQRPVGAMSVVVRDVHLEGPLQVPAPHDQ